MTGGNQGVGGKAGANSAPALNLPGEWTSSNIFQRVVPEHLVAFSTSGEPFRGDRSWRKKTAYSAVEVACLLGSLTEFSGFVVSDGGFDPLPPSLPLSL